MSAMLCLCRLGWRSLQHHRAAAAAAASSVRAVASSSSCSSGGANTWLQGTAAGRHFFAQQQQQQLQLRHQQLVRSYLSSSSSSNLAAGWQSQLQAWRGFAAEAAAASAAGGGGGRGSGKKSPITFNGMLLAVGAFLAVVAVAQNTAQKKVEGMMQRSQEVVGRAAVGGPFSLTDQDGRPFTNRDLVGRFSILYFGFTHCPDICPDELEKLAAALDMIEKKQHYQVQPVFISVDPARDTSKKVKEYVREFHPRLIGLTGSEEAVKACSKAYRVYFHKTGDSDTDYLVDHSIIMYLIDPAGEFVTFYGKNFTAEQLADSIGQHIAKWQQQQEQQQQGTGSGSGASGSADARVKAGTAGSQEGLAQR